VPWGQEKWLKNCKDQQGGQLTDHIQDEWLGFETGSHLCHSDLPTCPESHSFCFSLPSAGITGMHAMHHKVNILTSSFPLYQCETWWVKRCHSQLNNKKQLTHNKEWIQTWERPNVQLKKVKSSQEETCSHAVHFIPTELKFST
jgi:hypothetical protein